MDPSTQLSLLKDMSMKMGSFKMRDQDVGTMLWDNKDRKKVSDIVRDYYENKAVNAQNKDIQRIETDMTFLKNPGS